MLLACHGRSLDVWLFSGCSFIFVIIKRISCDDISPDFWVDLTVLGHFDCFGIGLHCSVSYHAKPIQYSISWLEKW